VPSALSQSARHIIPASQPSPKPNELENSFYASYHRLGDSSRQAHRTEASERRQAIAHGFIRGSGQTESSFLFESRRCLSNPVSQIQHHLSDRLLYFLPTL
jgi:hypothetical protein